MIKTEYIRILKNDVDSNNFLKINFKYDLGGYNYFTYEKKQRGYYLSISPIERSGNFEKYTGFTGVYHCILPVERQSKKQEAAAAALIPEYKKIMLDYFTNKYGYILEV